MATETMSNNNHQEEQIEKKTEKKEEKHKITSPFDFFNELDDDIVKDLVNKYYSDEDELVVDGNRTSQVKALSDDALATGVETLFKKCTKPILNDLDKELFKEGNQTKPSMVQLLSNKIFEKGLYSFFEELDPSIVANVASKYFGKKLDTENSSKDELVIKLEEDIYLQGLTKFFEQCSVNDLKSWCKKTKIVVTSSSKKRLARAIIFGEDVGQTNTRNYTGGNKSTQEEKPEIDKNMSKDELMKYKVDELKKYCKSLGLKRTGTKAVLSERIVKFHNGEQVEMESDTKSNKRSRAKKSDDDSYAEGEGDEDDDEKEVKKRKLQKEDNVSESSEQDDG